MRQPRSCRSTSRTSNVVHHRVGRPAHLAVQAEHRDAEGRIVEVGRLDHVVLLVAAQAVLRAERGGELDVAAGGQRIERMGQVARDRGGMGEQRHAPALQRRAQGRVGEQPVDAEFHGASAVGSSQRKAIGMMKVGLAWRMGQRPIGFPAARLLDHGREAELPAGACGREPREIQ